MTRLIFVYSPEKSLKSVVSLKKTKKCAYLVALFLLTYIAVKKREQFVHKRGSLSVYIFVDLDNCIYFYIYFWHFFS